MITPAQQALLDRCEDGVMTSDQLLVDYKGSNKSLLALLHELDRGGWVRILRKERRHDPNAGRRRLHTVYVFELTVFGLQQHAPPPGWVEPQTKVAP